MVNCCVFNKLIKLNEFNLIKNFKRSFITTCCSHSVYYKYRSGRETPMKSDIDDRPWKERFRNALRVPKYLLTKELPKLKAEMKQRLSFPKEYYSHGDKIILWNFKTQADLDKWHLTCDSTWDEGFSKAKFELSPNGHGLFHGYIDAENLPLDGVTMRVGFANIETRCPDKSFFRKNTFDFEPFTHLVMRVRGDGRAYAVILRTPNQYDINWFDLYMYGMYTHGGPYWQYVKIPFNKFVFNVKSRTQDVQPFLYQSMVHAVGFTLMDRNTGPFKLEFEYIGLEFDETSDIEDSPYEMYIVPGAHLMHS